MAIITVSRELGSSGYVVAARAAEILGYEFMDRQVIASISLITRVPEDIIAKCDEVCDGPSKAFVERLIHDYPTLSSFRKLLNLDNYYTDGAVSQTYQSRMEGVVTPLDKNPLLRSVLSSSEKVEAKVKWECAHEKYRHYLEMAIRELAKADNLVFIGRATQIILRDLPNAFHVRVIAPLEVRVKKAMELMKASESEATAMIKETDANRKKFIMESYNVDWADPFLYDMILNTGRVDVENAARAVAQLV